MSNSSTPKRRGKHGPRPSFTPEEVAEALRLSNGLVSIAAKALDCAAPTVRSYIANYPECAQAAAEAKEALKDRAESKLADSIDDREAWAVCFYLKTQAKDRGYVERQEVTGANGGPQSIRVEYVDDPEAPASGS